MRSASRLTTAKAKPMIRHSAHDDRHVARDERLDQQFSKARIVEQRLDHHETVDHEGELKGSIGHDRDRGVAHPVIPKGCGD